MYYSHLKDVQTECQIFFPLLLLETRYAPSIFDFIHFFFWKKIQLTFNNNILLTTTHADDRQQW